VQTREPTVRLTIVRKIALAVVAIVILCVGTMAWVTSANLQRGFVAYLNEMQTQDFEQLRDLLAERYRQEGNFEWLRRNPTAMRGVLDKMTLQLHIDTEGEHARRPPPGVRRPPRPEGNPYGRPPPRRDDDLDGPPPRRDDDVNGRPPRRDDDVNGPPARPLGDIDRAPPRARPVGAAAAPTGTPAQAATATQAPADPPARAAPPPGARDPMGFASRVSIADADGRVVIGPRDFPPGIERAIVVDGRTVGTMRLQPLRQASGSNASASGFLREQVRDIAILSGVLIALSVLLAVWLARHLLRPVAALRAVTARLARGDFAARAPVLSRDELAELALHVNAMAQALEESEAQRRRMMADISHELRTPLTVIRGEIEALVDGIRHADPAALASLHGEVLRLNKLVDDLHQLTLADAGDLHFDWQQLDLAALLAPLLERYRLRAAGAGLALTWALPPTPLMVRGDSGRLTQVIVNLLENSLRYTDAGGSIHVMLAPDAMGRAHLWVDDSAPGVPAGVHASLFERLYRVDGARTRERGGSGLGLSICQALVAAHGGSIAATPSTLGGIRVEVVL
jgi:two-component system sensor histidine kinase BaeS